MFEHEVDAPILASLPFPNDTGRIIRARAVP